MSISNVLTEAQSHALRATYECWLRKGEDGRWHRADGFEGRDGHAHEDIRMLIKLGLVNPLPIGIFITDAGSDHLFMFGAGVGEPLGLLNMRRTVEQ